MFFVICFKYIPNLIFILFLHFFQLQISGYLKGNLDIRRSMFYPVKSRKYKVDVLSRKIYKLKVDVLSRKIQNLQGRCFILENPEISRSMFYLGKSRNYKVDVLSWKIEKLQGRCFIQESLEITKSCFIYGKNDLNTILYILKANLRHKTYVLPLFQVLQFCKFKEAAQYLIRLYTVQQIPKLDCTLYSSLLYFVVHCGFHYYTLQCTVQYNIVLHFTLYRTILYCLVNFTVLNCTTILR